MTETNKVEDLSTPVASEKFCLNLSHGLHAIAQPLTILRASLCKEDTERMTQGDLQQLVARSEIEIERVCAFFSCMQQLVYIECNKPKLSPTPILPLLVNAVDGFNLMYKDSGLFLSPILPDSCDRVLMNSDRTLQALSTVLLIAHNISRAPETIELIVSSSSKEVRVAVRNLALFIDALDAQARLHMALAESIIRSQNASLSWHLQPFRVQIDFLKYRTGDVH